MMKERIRSANWRNYDGIKETRNAVNAYIKKDTYRDTKIQDTWLFEPRLQKRRRIPKR